MPSTKGAFPSRRGSVDGVTGAVPLRSTAFALIVVSVLLFVGAGWALALTVPAYRDIILITTGLWAVSAALLALWVAVRLRGEEERGIDLARALDLTPAVIRSVDGVILYWSKGCEDLCGLPASEAVGRRSSDLLQTLYPEPLEIIEAKLKRDGTWQGELLNTLPDGRKMWVMARWAWQEHGEGRPTDVVETVTDITESKRAQASIRDLEAELSHVSRVAGMGEMAAALAHELNQPLTAMANFLGAADHLLQSSSPAQITEARNAVRLTARQAERAGEIVRRMRDFVRRGETDVVNEPLRTLVEDAAGLAVILARHHPVDLAFLFDPKAARVMANRVQIQQVLVNLMRNAIEAMRDRPAPRKLTVSTKRLGGLVEITVADNGPGIATGVVRTLFDPFVTTKDGGMGVGLFISRRIIEAHGGEINVEPGQDGGAVFRFTLPAPEGVAADAS